MRRPGRPSKGDLLAGVSVALVLVPQALAYAELAGVPPIHGLYAAAIAPLFGALVGSSPYLQTGPVAMTSLLTFGALVHLAPTGSAEFAAYAALLALVVGAVRLLIGVVGAGVLAYLMSQPVIASFTVAGALLIVSSQMPTLLGVEPSSDNPAVAAAVALVHPGEWNGRAAAVGLATVLVVLAARRIRPLFPAVLVVTVAGVLFSRVGLLDVPEVGYIPRGLPPFDIALPLSVLPTLLVPGVVIALVGFAETAAIARRYAAADRRRWDPDREFTGQGLANLGAGLFSGYPVGGSFSRSALGRMSGATSRWSGFVAGLVVVATLPWVSVLSDLPQALLAGLVVVAVVGLIEVRPFVETWRFSKPQFAVAAVTFAATVAFAPRVERGVLVGVGLAVAVHIWRELRVDVETWREGATLHVRPSGVLYFASAPAVEGTVLSRLSEHADLTHIVVHLARLGRVDLTGVLVLRGLREEVQSAGVDVTFADVPPHARSLLRRVLGVSAPTGGGERGRDRRRSDRQHRRQHEQNGNPHPRPDEGGAPRADIGADAPVPDGGEQGHGGPRDEKRHARNEER